MTVLRVAGLLTILALPTPRAWPQDEQRKVLTRVQPEYPPILRRRMIGGTVRLEVVIESDGIVKGTIVVGGNAILADSAEKAVKKWRFEKGPSETKMVIVISFDPHL